MLPLGGGFRWVWACTAALSMLAQPSSAQNLRLGPFSTITAQGIVGYDSNVDDVFPEGEKAGRQTGDFYWMPKLSLNSKPMAMQPRTTLSLDAGIAYQDYLVRDDLDTELYNASVNFLTSLPRFSLGGGASTDYSVDAKEDIYFPGGMGRSPKLTTAADVFANWKYQKFRAESKASQTIERYDLPSLKIGDNDKTVLFAGAYLDDVKRLSLNGTWQKTLTTFDLANKQTDETVLSARADLRLFSWIGLFYSWERTTTILVELDEETNKTVSTFGVSGGIPANLLRHPKITYSLGFAYKDEQSTAGEDVKTWEPVHTVTVSDDYQLTKNIRVFGDAIWQSTVADNKISFIYNARLEQQLGARARQTLRFTQEPEPTFGSTADTKKTTYGYDLKVDDLFIYNLTFLAGASYEESTPLGVVNALTEKTTKMNLGLSHKRLLTRHLSRTLAYDYTSETSNFHSEGPKQRHLLTYAFTYDF